MKFTPNAELADAITKRLHETLAGQPPPIQGAAIADLLAIWLAGHPPEVREGLLANHIAMVRMLIPINARILETGE